MVGDDCACDNTCKSSSQCEMLERREKEEQGPHQGSVV